MSIGDYALASVPLWIAVTSHSAFLVYLIFRDQMSKGDRDYGGLNYFLVAALGATLIWAAVGLQVGPTKSFGDGSVVWLGLDLLRYASWFGFIASLLKPPGQALWRVGPAMLVPGVVGLLLATALLLFGLIIDRSSAEALSSMLSYAYLGLSICGLMLVEQVLRNLPQGSRWNAKPVFLGLAVIFCFDLYTFSQAALFRQIDVEAFELRAGVHSVAIPMLFMASRRDVGWLTLLQISRKAAFHSATLLLSGVYLLLISAVGYYVRYTGGDWGRALQIALVSIALAMLVFALLSGSVRARIRVFVSKNFFSYRYDYRDEWLRFTSTLSAIATPQEFGTAVISALSHFVESPGGGLWLRAGSKGVLVQSARLNSPVQQGEVALHSNFCDFLLERSWIFNLDDVRRHSHRFANCDVPDWLIREDRYWLLVPLISSKELMGFAAFERPRVEFDLNWEVLDILKTASSQAASYLSQMQATEALLEARKFESFNKMSAFVVHDLKNIVTQLSLMVKNAKRLKNNPEFQEDMLLTVENSLEKMRQLMLQLREGERPHGNAAGVELMPIVRRIAGAAQSRGRCLQLDTATVLSARGHEERVERVIGHVVQNAFDATPPAGSVSLTLNKEGSYARIDVRDTGCGMSEEFIRNRLFKPFQTTKESGMGIGSYESFQYLQELGGKIEVQSKPGSGTCVSVFMPLFFASQSSDLGLMEDK